jgi:hypothetical protein
MLRNNLKELGIFGLVVVFLFGGLYAIYRHSKKTDQDISSISLGANVEEKIILNSKNHTITIAHRTGTKSTDPVTVRTTYYGPHPAAILLFKGDGIKVEERTWGTEADPFLGFSYGDQARAVVGAYFLYYHRWELGGAALANISTPFSVRLAVLGSFNVWDNTSLFVGIDHKGGPVGGITIKF